MNEYNKLEERLFGDPNKKLKNFHFTLDKAAFAKTWGGEHIPGDFGPLDGHIDWTNSPFTAEERKEGLAKSLNEFMDAAEDPARSRRIRTDTDEWGNMLDDGHPDFMTFEERLAHVELMRKCMPDSELKSRYETEMVITKHLEPVAGKTVSDYIDAWEEAQLLRDKTRWGRYPKVDEYSKDLTPL